MTYDGIDPKLPDMEETIFTKEELLEMQIEEHLIEEAAEKENIKETYKELNL